MRLGLGRLLVCSCSGLHTCVCSEACHCGYRVSCANSCTPPLCLPGLCLQLQSTLFEPFTRLCQDTDASVRKAACEQLPCVLRVSGPDVRARCVDELAELLVDEETTVRHCCLAPPAALWGTVQPHGSSALLGAGPPSPSHPPPPSSSPHHHMRLLPLPL